MILLGSMVCGWGQDSLPEGEGKDIVETVCTQCHGLDYVTSTKKTAAGWKSTVDNMVEAEGAPLTEDEIDVVVQYLSRNFGKVVNVNKGTAKELEAGLNFTAQEAEEIVRYREQNGDFRRWEDLQKVPGLDSKKVEAVKDRLAF
jgi:competence ComEA-like helix-hairpin-helix protein